MYLPDILRLVLLCASSLMASPAVAQDADNPLVPPTRTSPAAPASGVPGDGNVQDALPSNGPTDRAKFAEFDKLKPQGQTSDVPGSFDTLLQDTGDFRSRLYEQGLYFRGQNSTSTSYDVSGRNPRGGEQSYNGQKFTVTNTLEGRVSLRTNDNGSDFGQVNASLAYTKVNWEQVGPTSVSFYRLDVYQTFLDRRIEVTAGTGANIVNYIGIFSGGNLLLANGLAATIPLEVGLSGGSATTPLVNVQINGRNGLYSKSGVQRSTGPLGAIDEARSNDSGLRLTRAGSNPLLIQEFGVLQPAAPGKRQLWIRGGGIYNFTDYTRLDRQGTERNWAGYLLADYQVAQPDAAQPFKGVYLGASALIAPGTVNVFKQTYELRAYAVGMVPGRPGDGLNLTVDYNLLAPMHYSDTDSR